MGEGTKKPDEKKPDESGGTIQPTHPLGVEISFIPQRFAWVGLGTCGLVVVHEVGIYYLWSPQEYTLCSYFT